MQEHKVMNLENFSPEILILIFNFLPNSSLFNVALVNRLFNGLVNSDTTVGRRRVGEFISHHLIRNLMEETRALNGENISSEQVVSAVLNLADALANDTPVQIDPAVAPLVEPIRNRIVPVLENPNQIFDLFPRETMPATMVTQFQEISRTRNRRQIIVNGLREFQAHREELMTQVEHEHIKKKLGRGAIYFSVFAAIITAIVLAIIYSPKPKDGGPKNDPKDDNDYYNFSVGYYFKLVLPSVVAQMHTRFYLLQQNRAFLEKYGNIAVLPALAAPTVATATVAAVTASATVSAAAVGGTAVTVGVVSNPVGWIVGASVSGALLVAAGVQVAWNYSRDSDYSISDFCKLARDGKSDQIIAKYPPTFNINQIVSFASCGYVEAQLGDYNPLALATAYGHLPTVALLVEYYHAKPKQLVGRKKDATALEIARRRYSFFTAKEQEQKIIDYLEYQVDAPSPSM